MGYVGKSCKRGESIMGTFKCAIKPRKTRGPKVLLENSRIMSKEQFYYLTLEITKIDDCAGAGSVLRKCIHSHKIYTKSQKIIEFKEADKTNS